MVASTIDNQNMFLMKTRSGLLVILISIILFIVSPLGLVSQNEIEINPEGIVLPRMTTTERDALTPVKGQLIFHINSASLQYYNGSKWISLDAIKHWAIENTHLHNTNKGNVGIGDEEPLWPLFVSNPGNALNSEGTHVVIDSLVLVISRKENSVQKAVGMGFQSSVQVLDETSPNIGAAILHERTGSNSKGKLHFATKTETTSFTDIPIHMTIDDEGDVGIGILNPVDKFEIAADSTENPFNIFIGGTSQFRVRSSGKVGIGTATPTDRVQIESDAGESPLRIRIGGSTKFKVNSFGNVGIGTPTPDWKIELVDTINAISGTNVDVSNLAMVIAKRQDKNNEAIGIGFQSSTNASSVGAAIIHERLSSNSRGKLHFATKNSTSGGVDIPIRMTINEFGNTGIGTLFPSSKLEVNGGDIRVTGGSFIDDGVNLDVPDYVFDESYLLKPLSEVEEFIQNNKHLEGFPSMHDIKGWANLSLQARDMILLEKVEELFLHAIDQEKKNDELEKKLDEQQKQIDELRELLISKNQMD